jgi:CTP-dependent riboflavin kinase
MKNIELPHDSALVLQQVSEAGEEDFAELAQSLRFSHRRLAHIVTDLARKRLIHSRTAHFGVWIRLTTEGKRLIHSMWPEARLAFS